MHDIIRWNLAARASRRYREADSIVVSIPKSGRTWLLFVLQAYCCAADGQPLSLHTRKFRNNDLSGVVYTHDLYAHRLQPRIWDRLRGKDLIPYDVRRAGKPILLLVRDPRDVIVSLYFQITLRDKGVRFSGGLPDLIRNPRIGVQGVVAIMNTWLREWAHRDNFMMLRYEDCYANPHEHFRKALAFLGVGQIDDALLAQAIKTAHFESMKKFEAEDTFKTRILKPANAKEPESFKVRRGKVGGYRDYLDAADINYLFGEIKKLDPSFGYR